MKDRKRPGVFDDAARAKFLAALAEGYSVTAAASRAGVHRRTAYWHRAQDPGFAGEWDDAWESGTDALEDRLLELTKGPSGFLPTIAALRARRPEKYRDNSKVEVVGKMHQQPGYDLRKLSDQELLEMEKLMLKAAPDQRESDPAG